MLHLRFHIILQLSREESFPLGFNNTQRVRD